MTDKEKECLQNLFLTDPAEDMNALKRRKGERAVHVNGSWKQRNFKSDSDQQQTQNVMRTYSGSMVTRAQENQLWQRPWLIIYQIRSPFSVAIRLWHTSFVIQALKIEGQPPAYYVASYTS